METFIPFMKDLIILLFKFIYLSLNTYKLGTEQQIRRPIGAHFSKDCLNYNS